MEVKWKKHQKFSGHSDPTCSVCDKIFNSSTSFAQHCAATKHVQKKKPSKAKDVPIPGGGGERPAAKPKKEKKVVEENSSADEEEDFWRCGECERDFDSEVGCEQHQRVTGHHDPECLSCQRTFLSQVSLAQHCGATGHVALTNRSVFGFDGFQSGFGGMPIASPQQLPRKDWAAIQASIPKTPVSRPENGTRISFSRDVLSVMSGRQLMDIFGFVDFSECVKAEDFPRKVETSRHFNMF
jgi:hypothetical protein